MKELTAAQGLLRCGECDNIFDAMKSLSQTLPEERRFAKLSPTATSESVETSPLPQQIDRTQRSAPRPLSIPWSTQSVLWLAAGLLALLLIAQLLYNGRHWLAHQPWSATLTQRVCEVLGCQLIPHRDIPKINLLSRNIYSHPNMPNVLTVSAALQNDAAFPQPYPLIEISFLDKNNAVIALRRFPPTEYLKNFDGKLMPTGVPDELLLNITDPGEKAVRFQFRFM
jgi:hypothetical protein